MLPIRRKTVPLDGADFIISPLTHRAATEFATKEGVADVRLEVIAFSLNRSRPDGSPELSVTDLREELDPFTTQTLFDEILKFSGLKVVAAGEAQAPSRDGSAPSAVGV